jgi:polycystin 1L2
MFNKMSDVNDWWIWFDNTLLPNVRVQNWYNGDPPYRLRGYLDDRVNRLVGYAIIRQIRQAHGTCRYVYMFLPSETL